MIQFQFSIISKYEKEFNLIKVGILPKVLMVGAATFGTAGMAHANNVGPQKQCAKTTELHRAWFYSGEQAEKDSLHLQSPDGKLTKISPKDLFEQNDTFVQSPITGDTVHLKPLAEAETGNRSLVLMDDGFIGSDMQPTPEVQNVLDAGGAVVYSPFTNVFNIGKNGELTHSHYMAGKAPQGLTTCDK